MRRIGRLHLLTDTRPGRDVLAAVAAALAGGVDTVQVRVGDEVTDAHAYQLTVAVLDLCRQHGVLCLVNDRLHIAGAAGADGGHVGADDLPVADGADYLGVGPAYPTSTKDGLPEPIGPAGITAVAEAVTVPVIAIGGVTAPRLPELRAAGAYGVAVVGAICGADDPKAAAADLRAAWRDPRAAGAGP